MWNGYNNVQDSTLILIYSESSSRSQKKFFNEQHPQKYLEPLFTDTVHAAAKRGEMQ